MGLETTTYINGLVVTNPTSADAKSQGDDHLRLIKSTIKNTFAAITGAITATHTELNFVKGVTSAIQAQLNNLMEIKGAISGQIWTGVHTFNGTTNLTTAFGTTKQNGDNTTALATTAFVADGLAYKANLNSPDLTGNPTAPTLPTGTNNDGIATTSFVVSEVLASSFPGQAGQAGKFIKTNGTTATWEYPVPDFLLMQQGII
ncbi:MAG: hypothetical protein WBI40_07540 [Methylococcaceae bacterium]